MLDAHATPAERAEADRLAKIDIIEHGSKIHDLSVSCYVGTGEDGRAEDVHERRLSDGTCRCGYHRLLKWEVTLTEDGGPGVVHTFTWGGTRSHAYSRIVQTMDSDPVWEGWSFELATRPTVR